MAILLACGSLTGCSLWHEYTTPEEIKEFWSPQPATYDEALHKANQMMSENRVDKGVDYYRLAAQMAEDQYGPNDPRIANASQMAGTILRDRGKYAEAEELYRKAYEVLSTTARPNSPDVVQLRKEFADVLMKNFKMDEAKKIYAQAGTASTAKNTNARSGTKKRH
jgi:tetratricopeptide (TPR) repeat protein